MIIGDALKRCALNYPDKPAVKDEYGKYFPRGFGYTYRELFEAANRLANSLLKLGLKKGDRVAVLARVASLPGVDEAVLVNVHPVGLQLAGHAPVGVRQVGVGPVVVRIEIDGLFKKRDCFTEVFRLNEIRMPQSLE